MNENFSEDQNERTNQRLSELLEHGETVTLEQDGVTTTVTRPAPKWLIEAILDGVQALGNARL